jgi:hypothetical protein
MSEATLEYIRNYYRVPAYRGRRVRYTGGAVPRVREGTIVGGASGNAYLLIRLDGERHARPYHPTYELEYLAPAGEAGE